MLGTHADIAGVGVEECLDQRALRVLVSAPLFRVRARSRLSETSLKPRQDLS